MATDDVVAGLPPSSQWTFQPSVADCSVHGARYYTPALCLAAECVADSVTYSRVLTVTENVAANASFIKQAQMIAFDPARAERMAPLLDFYATARHRSNISFPPSVAAFAVELFRHYKDVIDVLMPEHVYDLYNRLTHVQHFVVMVGTPVSGASRQ